MNNPGGNNAPRSYTHLEGSFMLPERQREKVCIIGCSDSCMQTPFHLADEFEFWGVNNLFWTLPKGIWNRWFEIHQITQNEQGVWIRRGDPVFRKIPVEIYLQQVNSLQVPTYMREANPLVDKSEPFPYDEMVSKFGGYFINTISWEIAFAIAMGFKEIRIYGVDMAVDTEYHHQRPSCEYFLGIAAGLGIKIWLPDTCDLLKTRFLYGKDEPEELQFRQKMEEVLRNLTNSLKEQMKKLDTAKDEVAKYHGAITGVTQVDKIWKNITGG